MGKVLVMGTREFLSRVNTAAAFARRKRPSYGERRTSRAKPQRFEKKNSQPWGLLTFRSGRDGACFCAGQGARRVVWSFQMNDEQRGAAQKQARPSGLRGKWRHASLRD